MTHSSSSTTRNKTGNARNIATRSCNHCCSGKATIITYSECAFVALGIQHATLMRRVVLSSVACATLQYFSALSHKRHETAKKKMLLNIKCVF